MLWKGRKEEKRCLSVCFIVIVMYVFFVVVSEKNHVIWSVQPFSTIFDITSERLGAAFRKFVEAFRSYIRAS